MIWAVRCEACDEVRGEVSGGDTDFGYGGDVVGDVSNCLLGCKLLVMGT
jgi:hypothetical protein